MSKTQNELIYPLDATPPVKVAFLAALQHVLASFVGIITPTLVIGGVLGLGSDMPYLISMALIVSGVGTFIQAKRFGPVGSGLMAVQGTSFAFLGAILAAGFVAKAKGGGNQEILSLIFTVCFFGAFIEIFLSRFLHKLKTFINPLVTGIVITTIGLSLIKVGMTDLAGGYGAEDLGSLSNLALGCVVLLIIITLNQSNQPVLRAGAIFFGLLIGSLLALLMGKLDISSLQKTDLIAIPIPFKYGFSFDFQAFLPIALIYLITVIESSGDLTATSMVSKQPITGETYRNRIKGGVLADGINSLIASVMNTFPNTTFSQNNGVIQLTGIASRYVAFWVAGVLLVLGLFPQLGAVLQLIPKPVLGGATLVMFGMVASAGIRILAEIEMDRRTMLIMAVSFGLGLGASGVNGLLDQMPEIIKTLFSSSVTTGGVAAILLNTLLPGEMKMKKALSD